MLHVFNWYKCSKSQKQKSWGSILLFFFTILFSLVDSWWLGGRTKSWRKLFFKDSYKPNNSTNLWLFVSQISWTLRLKFLSQMKCNNTRFLSFQHTFLKQKKRFPTHTYWPSCCNGFDSFWILTNSRVKRHNSIKILGIWLGPNPKTNIISVIVWFDVWLAKFDDIESPIIY